MKSLLTALALATTPLAHSAKPTTVTPTTDKIKGEVSSLVVTSGDKIGMKNSLALDMLTQYGNIGTSLTHGDDSRIGAEYFTSGDIHWAKDAVTLGARGLVLDNEQFGEIYGKLTDKVDLFNGVDAWIRVGVTAPTGVNLSSGANISLDDKNTLFLLGSHQEALSNGPHGTLWKAELTHDFGHGLKMYGGLDHWHGDDATYRGSNLLMLGGPGFERFSLHGQGFTGNAGIKYAHGETTAHAKASYNEANYWNFTGELSQKLGENMTLSGGILLDTRDTENTTGYVGVKWKF